MSIRIIKPGVLCTIQDAGRFGYRNIGIGTGGAMDVFALQVANYLCGNENYAVLEIHFPGPEIFFEKNARIAITGADFGATINNVEQPLWKNLFVQKDAVLTFSKPKWGSVAYLAVQGGFEAEEWLYSYSTHAKLAVGGHLGRSLQKGDRLNILHSEHLLHDEKSLSWQISAYELNKIYQPAETIRCIEGIEYAGLTQESKVNLEARQFTISPNSDRMGARLQGYALALEQPHELLSSAVDVGTVQLLPDGNMIVLLADHQTTGGYPRIASVIKADLPKWVQLKRGQAFNFKMVTVHEAENLLEELLQTLQAIKTSCRIQLNSI